MKNVSVLLVGGALDGQTYTAREDETTLQIHYSEKSDVVTDSEVNSFADEMPEGKFYTYKQESEGSERFVFVEG